MEATELLTDLHERLTRLETKLDHQERTWNREMKLRRETVDQNLTSLRSDIHRLHADVESSVRQIRDMKVSTRVGIAVLATVAAIGMGLVSLIEQLGAAWPRSSV